MSDEEPRIAMAAKRRMPKAPGARGRADRHGPLRQTLAAIDVEDPDFSAGLRIAALVREMRKGAKLSQSALGRQIGVSQARISELEAGLGRQGPSFLLMERIAAACGRGFALSPVAAGTPEADTLLLPVESEPVAGAEVAADVDAFARVKVGGKTVAGVVQAGRFSPLDAESAAQNVRIRLKAFDRRVLDQATGEIADTARRTGALIRGPIPLPTKIEKFTANRGPHIDLESREQFEIRTYKRMLDIVGPTTQTVDALMKLDLGGIDVELALGTSMEGLGTAASAVKPVRAAKRYGMVKYRKQPGKP